VERKHRLKENWATEDPMGRHVEGGSRSTVVTDSQKPEPVEQIHTNSAFISGK
jgi:hypothetical protein